MIEPGDTIKGRTRSGEQQTGTASPAPQNRHGSTGKTAANVRHRAPGT